MLKNKLTNEALDLKSSVYKRITNPIYLIIVFLTALGTYGFYLANPSPSIDWLSYDDYYSGVLFGQGRFTATIVERVLGLWDCPVWFEPLLGIACFIFGILVMLAIFDGFIEENSIAPSIIFTCIYISFPLLPEYFVFNGAILTVGGSTLLLSVALFLEIKYKDFVKSILIPMLLMAAVFSWYECMILPYIGLVFAILILKYRKDNGLKTGVVIQKGIFSAIVLVLGVIFETAITKVAIKLFSIEINTYANTRTYWTASLSAVLSLIESYASYWVLKVFFNPAFTILLIAGIVFFILFIINIKKTKNFSSAILFFGSLIPVFAMTLYRCGGPEFRTEQGMPFFVAFTAYLISIAIMHNKKTAKRIVSVMFVFLLIIQIGASNRAYWLNNQRFEEEKNVVLTVNSMINSNCEDVNKPVIFIGKYTLSDSLLNKLAVSESSIPGKIVHRFSKTPENSLNRRKIYDSVFQSYLTWSITRSIMPNKPENELYKFCDYIGVTFQHCTKAQYNEATKKYTDIASYPDKGCIVETDEYIVVKLK